MGCFSFMCKETGKAGLSTSFDGSPVHLFLLKKGKVIEHMHGNYDSYGRVFKPGEKTDPAEWSFEWKLDWNECCDLMFDKDKSNGLALIHADYWNEGDPYPTTRSADDPNQGWGDGGDIGGTDDRFEPVEKPFHKFNF